MNNVPVIENVVISASLENSQYDQSMLFFYYIPSSFSFTNLSLTAEVNTTNFYLLFSNTSITITQNNIYYCIKNYKNDNVIYDNQLVSNQTCKIYCESHLDAYNLDSLSQSSGTHYYSSITETSNIQVILSNSITFSSSANSSIFSTNVEEFQNVVISGTINLNGGYLQLFLTSSNKITSDCLNINLQNITASSGSLFFIMENCSEVKIKNFVFFANYSSTGAYATMINILNSATNSSIQDSQIDALFISVKYNQALVISQTQNSIMLFS